MSKSSNAQALKATILAGSDEREVKIVYACRQESFVKPLRLHDRSIEVPVHLEKPWPSLLVTCVVLRARGNPQKEYSHGRNLSLVNERNQGLLTGVPPNAVTHMGIPRRGRPGP